LLTSLSFLLLLPVFGQLKWKGSLSSLCFLLFAGFMVGAHLNSGFNEKHPRPTSLLYVLDADTRQAEWATYDYQLSEWTSQFIKKERATDSALAENTLSSKYSTGFSYVSEAPLKSIQVPEIHTLRDTLIAGNRELTIKILPQRHVNRLEVYTNNTTLKNARVNGIELSPFYLAGRTGPRLFTHYISHNEPTTLDLTVAGDQPLELTLYEASNDLLEHPLFSVPQRPSSQIPKPFVLNDAILVKKTLRFD